MATGNPYIDMTKRVYETKQLNNSLMVKKMCRIRKRLMKDTYNARIISKYIAENKEK